MSNSKHKIIELDTYKLLKNKNLKDGSVIETGTLLYKISQNEEGDYFNVETFIGHNVKKFLWVNKNEIEKVENEKIKYSLKEYKIREKDIKESWIKK